MSSADKDLTSTTSDEMQQIAPASVSNISSSVDKTAATDAAKGQQDCLLLDLPPELRLMIWEFCLVNEEKWTPCRLSYDDHALRVPAIAQVSTEIRAEVLPMLLKEIDCEYYKPFLSTDEDEGQWAPCRVAYDEWRAAMPAIAQVCKLTRAEVLPMVLKELRFVKVGYTKRNFKCVRRFLHCHKHLTGFMRVVWFEGEVFERRYKDDDDGDHEDEDERLEEGEPDSDDDELDDDWDGWVTDTYRVCFRISNDGSIAMSCHVKGNKRYAQQYDELEASIRGDWEA